MGNPTLYYYPQTSLSAGTVGLLEKVDFGEAISDIQIQQVSNASDTVSLSGRASRTTWQSGLSVRLVLERFTDDALARDLYSFESHARRGKHFGFARDSAKAVAVVPAGAPWDRGTTNISGSLNIFRKWESAAVLAPGDTVHIQSPAPKSNREEATVQTWFAPTTTSSLVLSGGLRYDMPYPAVLRHRDFFPVLFVPESELGRPMLTHDHRISWTFECQAVLYPGWSATLAEQAAQFGNDTAAAESGGTLDDLIRVVSSGTPSDGKGSTIVPVGHPDDPVTSYDVPTHWRG